MKTLRHRAILSIIATRPVHSQEELTRLLQEGGYEATQATVSRDIKELGLVKVPLKNGNGNGTHFKYIEPGFGKTYESRLHRVVADLVRNVSGSVNDIVLRTPPGSAMLVASAIDEAAWSEVIGTVGGDDTVLVILDDPAHLPVVKQRFQDMRSENPL
jgi:transcriptional regulator of arginine metabolism